MQYKVPQNVQREDTIIGPITLRQLLILFGGGGITYAIYTILTRYYFIEVWLAPVILGTTITLAFAFLRINEQPFHVFIINLLEYKLLPNKRLWRQGSGDTFISPFSKVYVNKKKEIEPEMKKAPDMDKIVKILDKQSNQKN